ncbi:MAG: ParB N-terminal domain-containing protein [Chthoniobacterales bacterium]|nr:ParB N-terminal domain-containing protein [Chthoniobacterales bacterium]
MKNNKMKHDSAHLSDNMQVMDIGTDDIKFFVRRSRAPGAYSRLKESIKELGLKQPIHVKDISQWSPSDRRRSDGGLFKYELICGQGRLQAFRELGWTRVPAIIVDVPEEEIVGRFLAENVMRKKLSWFEKANLVKRDVESGMDIESIRQKYFVTTGQAYKYLRILRHASDTLLGTAEIEKLSMNQAEELTSVDANAQEIVVEVMKEERLDPGQIKSLVKAAKGLQKKGVLSKSALTTSLHQIQAALKEVRGKLKVIRLHWTLGPYNLRRLLNENQRLTKGLDAQGVDYSDFMDTISEEEN